MMDRDSVRDNEMRHGVRSWMEAREGAFDVRRTGRAMKVRDEEGCALRQGWRGSGRRGQSQMLHSDGLR